MVASYTELIGSRYGDQLDEQGQQFVHFAVDGARRMQQLIRDLLEYSRVGRIADPPQRIELSALVREVWREIVVAQDLDVAVEALSLEGAAEVVADRKALAQALRALLVNAVRFAGASPCRVDVSCTTVGDQVRLDVRDSGIGVAPRDRERIFDLFVRLHGRSEYPGTGLGLAICRKVIEHHGGCVACVGNDSERGATFRVTLPAAEGGVT